jgi:tetratricopeptide (TPR) repeat protein
MLLIVAVGAAGLVLWLRSGGGEIVELSDEAVAAAQASGAAAKELVAASEKGLPTQEDLKLVASRERIDEIAVQVREERDAADPGEKALLTVLLSEVERLRGELDLAYDLALEGAEALPENSRARHMVAKAILARIVAKAEDKNVAALLGMMGDVKAYKAEVNAAVELDPTNVDARVGQVLTLLLPGFLGNKKKAKELIEEIGEYDPLRRDFWRAQMLVMDDDRLDEAVTSFEGLAEKHPSDPDVLLTLGELYIKQDAWSDAVDVLDRQIELQGDGPRTPHGYRALYQGAKARMKLGDGIEEALAMLTEFEEANPVGEPMPTMDRVKYHKGRALIQLARFEEAKAVLNESLKLRPNSKRVKEALAEAEAG